MGQLLGFNKFDRQLQLDTVNGSHKMPVYCLTLAWKYSPHHPPALYVLVGRDLQAKGIIISFNAISGGRDCGLEYL